MIQLYLKRVKFAHFTLGYRVYNVAPLVLILFGEKLSTIISHRWCWEKQKNQRFEIMVELGEQIVPSTVGATLLLGFYVGSSHVKFKT